MHCHLAGRLVVGCISAAAIVAFGGCGGGGNPVGTVAGTVTFQSQPVAEGQVSFRSEKTGKGNVAPLDSSGGFSLPEALDVGTYTVFVTPPTPPPPDMDQAPQPPPKEYSNIPEKYRSEVTSLLRAEVKEGENSFTFELD